MHIIIVIKILKKLSDYTKHNADESTITFIGTLKTNYDFINKIILEETMLIIDLMTNLEQILIYFDGIPSVTKIKEQLKRTLSNYTILPAIQNDIKLKLIDQTEDYIKKNQEKDLYDLQEKS